MEDVPNKAYRYSTVTEVHVCDYVKILLLEFIWKTTTKKQTKKNTHKKNFWVFHWISIKSERLSREIPKY